MRHTFFAALSTLLSLGAYARPYELPSNPESIFLQSLKLRLNPCFTALGAHASIPVAQVAPDERDVLFSSLLRGSGPMVNDGYAYVLKFYGASNSTYVFQNGGFAGSNRVFGPIPADLTCG